MRHFERAAAITFVALAICAPAWAQEEMPDRFMVRLGGYAVHNFTTVLRLDANDYPVGTYLDFSDTLGGETSRTVFRMDGHWRFNDRHAIQLAWYDLKFEGTRVIDEEIQWGDTIFPIDTKIDSALEFQVYKLSYQYSVFHNEKAELGASIGFHVMKLSASASGTAVASGASIAESKGEAVTAPLPVFGLFADYKFTPRFSAYYNYQFFFVNFEDKFKGGLQDFLLGLEYRILRNVSAGVAYNRFGMRAEIKKDVYTLNMDSNWNGGMFYVGVYF